MMNTLQVNDKWKLGVIEYGEESPMKCHKGNEVAVDVDNSTFFVHEVWVVTAGLDSVLKACKQYPGY